MPDSTIHLANLPGAIRAFSLSVEQARELRDELSRAIAAYEYEVAKEEAEALKVEV
jgi:hypothetical protein